MTNNYKNLADEVRQVYYEWIHQALERFLEDLTRYLTERSSREVGVGRAAFIEAIAQVNERRDIAEARLKEEVEKLFSPESNPQLNVTIEELSLVDDFVVERYVNRAKMIGYLMTNHGEEIKKVEARLGHLQSLGVEINPQALTPLRVFQAMGSALDEFELGEQMRIEAVKLSESELIPLLVIGYQVVNETLDKHGIEITYQITSTDHGEGLADSRHYSVNHLLQKLENLSANLGDVDKEKLINDQDRRLLTELIRRVPPPDPVTEDGTPPRISDADAAQMKEVNDLIQSIAGDEEVDARVQKLVRDLHLPMTITSLRNPMQFSNATHPGRMLMRELTMFGKTHPEVIDRRLDEVSHLVQHVMLENGSDMNVMAEASESIWRIGEQEITSYIKDLIRAGSVDRGTELREKDARRRVVLEIREQLVGKILPAEIKPVICKLVAPWMVNRYLKYGHNSVPWLESVAYMRVAMDAIQPVVDESSLKRRVAMRSHLLMTLRKRTAKSALPAETVESMIAGVEEYFASLADSEKIRAETGTLKDALLAESATATLTEEEIG